MNGDILKILLATDGSEGFLHAAKFDAKQLLPSHLLCKPFL